MVKGSDFIKLAGYADVIDGLTDLSEDWESRNTWFVGSNVTYALHVHEGTSRMEGRPYLSDAIAEVVRKHGDELADGADGADDLVRRIALELEDETKRQITAYGAVDTGHLRRSISAQKL